MCLFYVCTYLSGLLCLCKLTLPSERNASVEIYLLLVEMLIVNCAPKIGHLLFDPLYFEAEENENKVGIFRKKMYEELTQPKRKSQQENMSDDDFLENKDVSQDQDESTTIKFVNTNPVIQFSPDNNNDKEKNKIAEVEPLTLLNEQTSNSDAKNIIIYPTTDPEDYSKLSNGFSLPIRILRNKEVVASVIKSGYDYDMQICTLINGVIMCGYNKNIGPIESDKQITEIENGCKIRRDRLECGNDRPSKASGNSSANSRQMLRGNSKIIQILSSQLQETKVQNSNIEAVPLRQYTSISSLFCNDCKATTHKRDSATEVVTTTETTSATSTFIMPSPTVMFTTTKEEPTTPAGEKTKLLSTTETSTPTFERLTSPKTETATVKTSKRNLRNNKRKNYEQISTNYNEKIVDVTRCVEKGYRIVCYIIKSATKPIKQNDFH